VTASWILRLAGLTTRRAHQEAKDSIAREQAGLKESLSADDRRLAASMKRRAAGDHVVFGTGDREGPYCLPITDFAGTFAWVSAGTGSGKSRLVGGIVSQLAKHVLGGAPVSLIVVDMKGELADLTLRALAQLAVEDGAGGAMLLPRLFVIRPFLGDFLPELQLLAADSSQPVLTQAHAVAETLESSVASLGVRQSGALTMLLALAIEARLSLLDLRWLLYDLDRVVQLAEQSALPEVRLFVRTRLRREASATIDGVGARLDGLLRVGALKGTLAGPGMLDLRRCFAPGSCTVVDFGGAPLGAEGAKRAFASLLLTRLTWAAFDARRTERSSTVVIADEIQEALTSATTHHIERLVTTGRSYGLGLWVVNQSAAQLPTELKTILGTNARFRVIGRSGADDAKMAAEWLPSTGRVVRPRLPGEPPRGREFLTAAEELRTRTQELATLPPRRFLVADRLAPFHARYIEAAPFNPPPLTAFPGELVWAIEQGAVGKPRNALIARAAELEEHAAGSLEHACVPASKRKAALPGAATTPALPDVVRARRSAAASEEIP
jgi:hypothetical protein